MIASYEKKEPTVNSIIRPIKAGDGFISASDIPIYHCPSFGVDLISGDNALSMAEDFLSREWSDAIRGEPRGLKTLSVFRDVLKKIENKYDYIMFDMGPSLGAINRTILFSVDFFLMPVSCDIYSIQAVDNIADSMRIWKDELARGLEDFQKGQNRPYGENAGQLVPTAPRFIGFVKQQYASRINNGESRPVKAYERIMDQLPSKIHEALHPFYADELTDSLEIGNIPNFSSLVPLSQMANKPIFTLSAEDGVVGAHFKKVGDFKNMMSRITVNLQHNIGICDGLA